MGADFGGFECQAKVFHKAVGNLGKLLGKGVIGMVLSLGKVIR